MIVGPWILNFHRQLIHISMVFIDRSINVTGGQLETHKPSHQNHTSGSKNQNVMRAFQCLRSNTNLPARVDNKDTVVVDDDLVEADFHPF